MGLKILMWLFRTLDKATYPIHLGTVGQSNQTINFLMFAPCLRDGHGVGWIEGIVHSTEPVFRSGCYWISERAVAVRELLKEGVIFVVSNVCQLAVDNTVLLSRF